MSHTSFSTEGRRGILWTPWEKNNDEKCTKPLTNLWEGGGGGGGRGGGRLPEGCLRDASRMPTFQILAKTLVILFLIFFTLVILGDEMDRDQATLNFVSPLSNWYTLNCINLISQCTLLLNYCSYHILRD